MAYYDNPGQVNDEAISIVGGKTFQVIQVADSFGDIVNPAESSIATGLGIPPHDYIEVDVPEAPTDGTQTFTFYRNGPSGELVATLVLTYVGGNFKSAQRS